MPLNGEVPQVDWPVVTVGDQKLIVRWTFYAQWMLSKRKVDVRQLGTLMQAKDASLVDVMVECFAAAVAENFTTRGLEAPTVERWALMISQASQENPAVWNEVNQAIWAAVGKAQPAASPAPIKTAEQPGQAPN